MAYDLEEQEQIDEIKAWWTQYGKLVMLVAIGFLASLAAFQGWRYYQSTQAQKAVTLYEQLDRALQEKDPKKVRDIAAQVVASYGSTAYARMAAFAGAKASFETGDLAGAKAQLQWALEHAKEDEMRDLARLRLSGVLLDEKKYDEALKMLEAKPTDAYTGLFADLRGDIHVAQGKAADARAAYQIALEKSDPSSAYRGVIDAKLDALGEAK
jgi:predicted negative regulator of RcsB-dependent stress response